MRTAALALLDAYKAANPDALKQTHHARPMSLFPPSGFVDAIVESSIDYTPAGTQRTPNVVIRFVRGTFDRGDVGDANDDLVDGFIAFVVDNRHAAGANTLSVITAAEDDDGWIPEWFPPDKQQAYYTTTVTLSGEGLFGGLI